jgi:hypothetical protein
MKPEGDPVVSARATLLALRASLHRPEGLSVPGVLLLPEGVPLPRDQAVQRLVRANPTAAQPALCVGFVALGCFAVARWLLSPAEASAQNRLAQDDLRWLQRELTNQPEARILLEGIDEDMRVTFPQLAAWYSSYQLPLVDRHVKLEPRESTQTVAARIRFSAPASGVGPTRRGAR